MSDPAATALQGDEGAYYAEHHERLRAVVRVLARVSEDQLQDACASAWLVFLRVQPDRDHAFAWLVIVAKHEAWRLSGRDARQAPLMHDDDDDLAELPAQKSDPYVQLCAKELFADVISTLPERKRRILGLAAAGFKYAEIAEITGDTQRTVDRQLRRARERLGPLVA